MCQGCIDLTGMETRQSFFMFWWYQALFNFFTLTAIETAVSVKYASSTPGIISAVLIGQFATHANT